MERTLAALGGAACTAQMQALLDPIRASTIWAEIGNLHTAIVNNPYGGSIAVTTIVVGTVSTFIVLKYLLMHVRGLPLQATLVNGFMTAMHQFYERLTTFGSGRNTSLPRSPVDEASEELTDLVVDSRGRERGRNPQSRPPRPRSSTPSAPPMPVIPETDEVSYIYGLFLRINFLLRQCLFLQVPPFFLQLNG